MPTTKDLPCSGHVYFPNFRPATFKYVRPAGRCCAAVADGGRSMTFHLCNNKSKVEREVDHHGKAVKLPYCNVHDPIQEAARKAKRQAEWDDKRARERAHFAEQRRKRDLGEAAILALKLIARGDNDARARAQEVLTQFDEPFL